MKGKIAKFRDSFLEIVRYVMTAILFCLFSPILFLFIFLDWCSNEKSLIETLKEFYEA